MEKFLRGLLPRLLSKDRTFQIHPFQGKPDLLKNIEGRLRGYAAWLPQDCRIVVVVDRDDDDCQELKQQMEDIAGKVELRTRTGSPASWQLVNRIAIEELEAWYFGDWDAVVAAYPRVNPTLPRKQKYRDPDAIPGGTWEEFERVVQRRSYFKSGLPKIRVAQTIAEHFDPYRCRSHSFQCFRDALLEAVESTGRSDDQP